MRSMPSFLAAMSMRRSVGKIRRWSGGRERLKERERSDLS